MPRSGQHDSVSAFNPRPPGKYGPIKARKSKSLQALTKDLAGGEEEPFNVGEYISFSPSPEEGGAGSNKLPDVEADAAVDEFLENI